VARVGVFVCHCGENIARSVDVKAVARNAAELPGVVHSTDYPFLCSAPGQRIIQEAIRDHGLDRVVVSACSPQLHGTTFRRACAGAGVNPFQCEMANIREQCSWVHPKEGEEAPATPKACRLVASAVGKVRNSRPLQATRVAVTKRALVIGGGVAGIRAALDIAAGGHPVTLVEREASLGGNMARLSETFPTLDCSQCILTPLMVEASHHPNIELLTYSEVEDVRGFVGNFTARIRKKARFIDPDACTACDDCVPVCPVAVPNRFDRDMAWRKAIHIPFPQAVPSTYTIDMESCLNSTFKKPRPSSNGTARSDYRVLACERCLHACKPKAINFDQAPEIIEREVGAVVYATGYELPQSREAAEHGYGEDPDVLDGMEFERLLSATGPTGGVVRRPSDGKIPEHVVFIQCVGSRDPHRGVSYCSRVCCMYTAKQALLYKHKVHGGKATVFYIDIRAAGKGYEEFIHRVMGEERVLYIRGRVGRVARDGGKLRVFAVDTLSGEHVAIGADMVVLATAMGPSSNANGAGRFGDLRVPTDPHGFAQEAHPKLRPAETLTAGIFPAGAAQAPKDIPDTVSQASAAAAKILAMFSQPELEREPTTAQVNEARCVACFDCARVCPYQAIERFERRNREGELVRVSARVNPAMCEGCGTCVSACRPGAMDLAGFADEQIFEQLQALSRPGKNQMAWSRTQASVGATGKDAGAEKESREEVLV
jgi:heterodisulfide reductase subunit A2